LFERRRHSGDSSLTFPLTCSSQNDGDWIATLCSVGGSEPDVLRLRTDFLFRAVQQLRVLIANGEFEEASEAADRLATYFAWVKDDFSAQVRSQLSEQIRTMREAAENISREHKSFITHGGEETALQSRHRDLWKH
jgi:hypothetical protein